MSQKILGIFQINQTDKNLILIEVLVINTYRKMLFKLSITGNQEQVIAERRSLLK